MEKRLFLSFGNAWGDDKCSEGTLKELVFHLYSRHRRAFTRCPIGLPFITGVIENRTSNGTNHER